MKIALCGPANLHELATLQGVELAGVPKGIGPTPLAPIIRELLRRDHQVTLFTLSHDLATEKYFEWDKLRIFVGPSRQLGGARTFYAAERDYLQRVIAQDAPAFVHSHWTYEFTLGVLAAKLPTLVTIHDLPWNVLRYFRDRCRAVRLLLAYVVAGKAKHYTAVSQDAAKHFQRYMRPGASIRVVPNFVPEIVLQTSLGPQLHPQRPLVFATVLQGWTRRKNPKAALEAFALARKILPNIALIMFGTDYEASGPAATWAAEHNLAAGICFHGVLSYQALIEYMKSQVDVLLMPSLDEALSMTVLESMALGKPVIAGASTPGIGEQLDYGRAGLLANVRHPQQVAEAMMRLQKEPGLYENVSQAAYDRVSTVYLAKNVVPQYEDAYANLIKIPLNRFGMRLRRERC